MFAYHGPAPMFELSEAYNRPGFIHDHDWGSCIIHGRSFMCVVNEPLWTNHHSQRTWINAGQLQLTCWWLIFSVVIHSLAVAFCSNLRMLLSSPVKLPKINAYLRTRFSPGSQPGFWIATMFAKKKLVSETTRWSWLISSQLGFQTVFWLLQSASSEGFGGLLCVECYDVWILPSSTTPWNLNQQQTNCQNSKISSRPIDRMQIIRLCSILPCIL